MTMDEAARLLGISNAEVVRRVTTGQVASRRAANGALRVRLEAPEKSAGVVNEGREPGDEDEHPNEHVDDTASADACGCAAERG